MMKLWAADFCLFLFVLCVLGGNFVSCITRVASTGRVKFIIYMNKQLDNIKDLIFRWFEYVLIGRLWIMIGVFISGIGFDKSAQN